MRGEESTVVTLHETHEVVIRGVPSGAVEEGEQRGLAELEDLGEVTAQTPTGDGEVVSVEPTNGAGELADGEDLDSVSKSEYSRHCPRCGHRFDLGPGRDLNCPKCGIESHPTSDCPKRGCC